MNAVDPDVLVGRGLAWKEAWEEDLSDRQRREVRRAVMRGRKLDNGTLIPYLLGLLARERRTLRWKMVLWPAPFALWLFVGIQAKNTFGRWYSLGLAGVWFVGGAIAFWVQGRWLGRAERLNLVRPRPE